MTLTDPLPGFQGYVGAAASAPSKRWRTKPLAPI